MSEQTPEQRAAEAAEQLGAEGTPVTARAVRERSGVRMTVAAEAARVWNEREAQAETVPDAPPAVQARFVALWREAVTVAREEFAEARAGWRTRIEQVEGERQALAEEVAQIEAERDTVRGELTAAHHAATAAAAAAAHDLLEVRSRADRAEARADTVEAERDRLIIERDRLLTERDALRDQIRQQPN